MPVSPEFQHTLAKAASVSGTSLHTGEKVTLKLQPAAIDSGIKFRRKDLQDEPTIDAKIENLKTVERATTIGEGSIRVHTVEHILSALSAMGVDNAIVEMDANEPPIGDGSALALRRADQESRGRRAGSAPENFSIVREPMHVETKSGSLLVILPDDKFRISCTQSGPEGRFTQFFSTEITPANLRTRNRAGAHICLLRRRPAADGKESDQGRQPRKCHRRARRIRPEQGAAAVSQTNSSRHKILDIIGDLALVGQRIRGHVIAVKPGHSANAELVARDREGIRAGGRDVGCHELFPPGEGGLDINEMMQILPHRYPFLMVDRIIGFEGETKCTGVKSVTINEPYFQGHFPGHPGDAGRVCRWKRWRRWRAF